MNTDEPVFVKDDEKNLAMRILGWIDTQIAERREMLMAARDPRIIITLAYQINALQDVKGSLIMAPVYR